MDPTDPDRNTAALIYNILENPTEHINLSTGKSTPCV